MKCEELYDHAFAFPRSSEVPKTKTETVTLKLSEFPQNTHTHNNIHIITNNILWVQSTIGLEYPQALNHPVGMPTYYGSSHPRDGIP